MQIITVAPIIRGVPQSALTYFSKEAIATGMVVLVPIRTREVPAIVLGSESVSNAKTSLKNSEYAVRKISQTKPRRIWLPTFLSAVEATATFSAKKLGETLLSLTPQTILEASLDGTLAEPSAAEGGTKFEASAIQGNTETRLETYRLFVREAFARKESVFICAPTEDDVARIAKKLEHGIESYTFAFHGGVSKKKILEKWKTVTEEKHPVLVVATPQYLSIPRHFSAIILEEEHSHAWRMVSKPLIDQRIFAEEYARSSKSKFITGSSILRAETHERIHNGEISEFGNHLTSRSMSEINTLLIDPRSEEKLTKEITGRKGLIMVSKEAMGLLMNAEVQKENILLLAGRKGLSPITACGDCGTLVRCNQCDAPFVVHKREMSGIKTQVFVCHGCGFTRVPENNVHETCKNCGGWKLEGIGIGIERIYTEIAKLFPNTQKFILDSEHAPTKTKAKKIISEWSTANGGILIATGMALPLLETIPHTIIISIDSLFSIPDIRIPERIFSLMLTLREKTTKTLLVQTRADDTTIFTQALNGNLSEFTKGELSIRKMFSYPPYGTIIKITARGGRSEVAEEIEKLKIFLEKYSPLIPETLSREPNNVFRKHMILKLSADSWPNKELHAKLLALPSQFTIEVNPDNLL